MSEELSPETRLYVKEEIEKVRKEVKEEVEKVKSKATKTFSTVVIVVGLLTGLGVYGIARDYMKTAINEGLSGQGIQNLRSIAEDRVQDINDYVEKATVLRQDIDEIKKDAQDTLSKMKKEYSDLTYAKTVAELEKRLLTAEGKLEPLKDYTIKEIYHYRYKGDDSLVVSAPEHISTTGWEKKDSVRFYAFVKTTD
ncbi:MAG: hypothetical protein ACYS3S_24210 [Planctomycetota bacterium]|jgi:F0F1-type ATP synthase membrane subunit b/b'